MYLGISAEKMDEVAEEKEIWASLLRQIRPPISDRWMDG